MEDSWRIPVDLSIVILLLVGISQFRTPRRARLGNLAGAVAIAGALALVLATRSISAPGVVLGAAIVGSSAGWVVAARVGMVGIPAMVAFQNGAGAAAAFLVSFVELVRGAGEGLPGGGLTALAEISGLLGLLVGAATLAGSLVASGKLGGILRQTPTVLPLHGLLLAGLGVAAAGLAAAAAAVPSHAEVVALLGFASAAALAVGTVFALRIGGADMPVLIASLNAASGLAALLCGFVVDSGLLVACGAAVAASGSILTRAMCRAMNRSAVGLFLGRSGTPGASKAPQKAGASVRAGPGAAAPGGPVRGASPGPETPDDPVATAAALLEGAESVVIIPGYGMALSDSQEEVARLAELLAERGKDVRFGIHPIAGRMPGHMHVLLAEAEVDYGLLLEPGAINPRLPETDLVLVVGACDVVNPAAIDVPGTPISGMPILKAHEARRVIVCNLDRLPGYSGVENPLYDDPRTVLVLGDAKESLGRILAALAGAAAGGAGAG